MSNHAPEIWCVRAGEIEYRAAREVQRRLEAARQAGEIPDVLLLLEHPPVYTRGRRATADELPMGKEWYRSRGIAVEDTDRGGRVTYHGPGQLVGYPIVSLRPYGDDVHEYVRRMERAIVASLGEWGIRATPIDGLTGVWVEGGSGAERRKIAAIGIHVSRGVTTHGFAINVNNDLQPFEWIVPCGIEGCRVTSVCRESGAEQDMDRFAAAVARHLAAAYGRRPVELPAAELAARVAGLEALAAATPAVVALER